jgi:hypothetical protein
MCVVVGLDVPKAVTMKNTISYSPAETYPEDGDSTFLRNLDELKSDSVHIRSHPRFCVTAGVQLTTAACITIGCSGNKAMELICMSVRTAHWVKPTRGYEHGLGSLGRKEQTYGTNSSIISCCDGDVNRVTCRYLYRSSWDIANNADFDVCPSTATNNSGVSERYLHQQYPVPWMPLKVSLCQAPNLIS